MNIESLGTIVGVWAHPDDEVYLCGGIMAAAARAGRRVACVTATRGELGSIDEERWPPSEMAAVRELELAEALGVLGVSELHWLDYIDGSLPEVAQEEAIAKIAALLEEIRPDTVLTFGPEGMTGHPDHIAISQWTRAAFESAVAPGARLLYATKTFDWAAELRAQLNIRDVFGPGTPPEHAVEDMAISFELPPELLELKLQALGKHHSQTQVFSEMMGPRLWRKSNAEEFFIPAE